MTDLQWKPADISLLEKLKIYQQINYQSFKKPEELSAELLERFAKKWMTWTNCSTLMESVEKLLEFSNSPQLCGCLGPRDNWPWCPCSVNNKMETYKVDIAIYILEHLTPVIQEEPSYISPDGKTKIYDSDNLQ